MSFSPLKTNAGDINNRSKVLLYADSGWGKTTQCLNYQRALGKGFVLSGESGLRVLREAEIDYLPFTTWDGQHDPDAQVYSFRGICSMMQTQEFKDQQYDWICLDSLSEISYRLLTHLDKVHEHSTNVGERWGDFNRMMIGSLKWLRDLPYHVLVTALVRSEEDANGTLRYWPMIDGRAAARQVPAIFDYVLAGIRTEVTGEDGTFRVVRQVITDKHAGYDAKVRDPSWHGSSLVTIDDVTDIVLNSPTLRQEAA